MLVLSLAMYAQLGFIIEVKNKKERISSLENIFVARERRDIKKKKSRIPILLRKSILKMLLSLEKPLPSEYSIIFSADSLNKIVKSRDIIVNITGSYFEKLKETYDVPGLHKNDFIVALHILRGLGLIEMLSGGRVVVLTKLGDIVRSYIASAKGLSDVSKLSAMLLASLPFSTKMRVIYGLYYMYGADYAGFYNTLRDKLFTYDPRTGLNYYRGVERLGLEVLNEIVLTRAGESRDYVSETQILVSLLKGYLKLFDDDRSRLNDLFRSLNKHLRYPHRDRFKYESAAWEALAPGNYIELDKMLEKYRLKELEPLIKKLGENFTSIEYQLQGLYGLPQKY
jgi:hypothetical protein